MKFDYETITDLFFEETCGTQYGKFELIEAVCWEDCGKSGSGNIIFKFENRFFKLHCSRWGNPYQGYDHIFDSPDENEMIECAEVVPKEVRTIKWVTKKC